MNSIISNGVPLDFDRTTLFIAFFGCHCAFNRSMLGVDQCCWCDRWRCKWIDRQVCLDYFIGGLDYSCFAAFFKIVGWVGNAWGLRVGGCFFWFGWDVAEGAVFVGDIGVGAEVVTNPIARKLHKFIDIPRY
jgi:hypothetical protein